MNVATITMPRAAAKRKLKAYRTALHRRADAEYSEAESAYKALAAGTPVLVLSEVIANAPRDAKGRPRLAIARADRRQVRYTGTPGGGEVFDWDWEWRIGRRLLNGSLATPRSDASPRVHLEGFALVPMVPPEAKRHHALDKHFVLWEVEQWADRPIGMRADRDPFLLKRLSADLFAVVAEWELTEIERAIMAGFRRLT